MKLFGEGEKRLTNGFGILEDLEDIPLDEIMALGAALTAAAATSLVMIEAFNRINMTTDERIRKLEADIEFNKAIMEGTAKTVDIVAQGAASIIKESLMVGSVLPDKV